MALLWGDSCSLQRYIDTGSGASPHASVAEFLGLAENFTAEKDDNDRRRREQNFGCFKFLQHTFLNLVTCSKSKDKRGTNTISYRQALWQSQVGTLDKATSTRDGMVE